MLKGDFTTPKSHFVKSLAGKLMPFGCFSYAQGITQVHRGGEALKPYLPALSWEILLLQEDEWSAVFIFLCMNSIYFFPPFL